MKERIHKIYIKYKRILMFICAILFLSTVIYLNIYEKDIIKEEKISSTVIDKKINVSIKGEVVKPKSFNLEREVYLYELIDMCGGLTRHSDIENINMIEKLSSSKEIKVDYTEDENVNLINVIDLSKSNNTCLVYFGPLNEKINIYIVDKGDSLYDVLYKGKIKNIECDDFIIKEDYYIKDKLNLININKASLEDFEKLENIGKATAKKIIEYREENGLFSCIEDIMKVKGIGINTFEIIRNKICV